MIFNHSAGYDAISFDPFVIPSLTLKAVTAVPSMNVAGAITDAKFSGLQESSVYHLTYFSFLSFIRPV